MKKIILCFMVLVSAHSNAAVKFLYCPESILCNYEKGQCSYPRNYIYKDEWYLHTNEAKQSFRGAIEIKLEMAAMLKHFPMVCLYVYGNRSMFMLKSKSIVINKSGLGWYSEIIDFGKKVNVCRAYIGTKQCATFALVRMKNKHEI